MKHYIIDIRIAYRALIGPILILIGILLGLLGYCLVIQSSFETQIGFTILEAFLNS